MGHSQWWGQQGQLAHKTWADPYLQFNSFMQQSPLQGRLAPYNNFMQYPQYPMFNQFGRGYGYGKGRRQVIWNNRLLKGQGQDWSKWNTGIIPAQVGPLHTGLGTGRVLGTGNVFGTGQVLGAGGVLGSGQALANWNTGFGHGQSQGWGMWNSGMGKGGYQKRYGHGKWNRGFGGQFTYPMGMMQGFGGGWNFMGQDPMLSPAWMYGGLGGFGAPLMGMGKVSSFPGNISNYINFSD